VPAEGETIFHPNIANYFCIADYWWAGTKLSDIVVKLGDMIQWREVNPNSPLDAMAAKWAVAHEGSDFLPVGQVDLGVGATDGPQSVDVVIKGAEPTDRPREDSVGGLLKEVPATAGPDLDEGDFELTILSVGG
jgi:hypothetical protein